MPDEICKYWRALEFEEAQAAENYKEKAKTSDGENARILLQIADDELRHAELLHQLGKGLSCNDVPAEAAPHEATSELPPCGTTPEPMETWISKEFGPDGECRPCRMAPAASLYLGVLEKANMSEAAKQLEEAYETENPLTLGKAMDNIKASAKEPIKAELQKIDCFTQSYQSEDGQEDGLVTGEE